MEAVSLSSTDTEYSACSVEFCPTDPSLFVCGTYQIIKEDEDAASVVVAGSDLVEDDEDEVDAVISVPVVTRFGRCLLYHIDEKGQNLQELQRFDGPAILDIKWSQQPINGRTTLAIADAKGGVQLHAMDDQSRLQPIQSIECADDSVLCLSLDWSNRRRASSSTSIVVSLSNGDVSLLQGESEMQITSTWKAHDYEPWIAAFDCWEPNTVWTGGDDCKLKCWDLREGCDTPVFTNKRFEGGVTTIQSHPLLENIFAVGSYDAQVRIFDRRKPLVPLVEYDAGGGIWRLKWHPTRPERLLIAAMHDGFKVVDFNGLSSTPCDTVHPALHTRFDGHDSLAYGVDWSGRKTKEEGKDIVASCSFYDHALHVWTC